MRYIEGWVYQKLRNYAHLVFRDIFREYGPGKCVEGLREMCGKVISLVIINACCHQP